MLTMVPIKIAWSRAYYWSIRDSQGKEVAKIGGFGDKIFHQVEGLDEVIVQAKSSDAEEAWLSRNKTVDGCSTLSILRSLR